MVKSSTISNIFKMFPFPNLSRTNLPYKWTTSYKNIQCWKFWKIEIYFFSNSPCQIYQQPTYPLYELLLKVHKKVQKCTNFDHFNGQSWDSSKIADDEGNFQSRRFLFFFKDLTESFSLSLRHLIVVLSSFGISAKIHPGPS